MNRFSVIVCIFCFVLSFMSFDASAKQKQQYHKYKILSMSSSPVIDINGREYSQYDVIDGSIKLKLKKNQAVRLRQIRNDGKRVVFTIGYKNILKGDNTHKTFKRKMTSSKGGINDVGKLMSRDVEYLIDSIFFPINIADDCWIEVQSANNNRIPRFRVDVINDTLVFTASMFKILNFAEEQKLRITCTNGKETILITDQMTIIYLPSD